MTFATGGVSACLDDVDCACSRGTIRAVLGHDVTKEPTTVRRLIGVALQEAGLDPKHNSRALTEGPERAAEEISQLLYHAQVLMIASGVSLDDVYAHL